FLFLRLFVCFSLFSSLLLPPPLSTLFPYTTLFRSFASFGAYFTFSRMLRISSTPLFEAASISMTSFELPFVILLQIGHSLSGSRSEEHTSELQSRFDLVCRLLLEKKKKKKKIRNKY